MLKSSTKAMGTNFVQGKRSRNLGSFLRSSFGAATRSCLASRSMESRRVGSATTMSTKVWPAGASEITTSTRPPRPLGADEGWKHTDEVHDTRFAVTVAVDSYRMCYTRLRNRRSLRKVAQKVQVALSCTPPAQKPCAEDSISCQNRVELLSNNVRTYNNTVFNLIPSPSSAKH